VVEVCSVGDVLSPKSGGSQKRDKYTPTCPFVNSLYSGGWSSLDIEKRTHGAIGGMPPAFAVFRSLGTRNRSLNPPPHRRVSILSRSLRKDGGSQNCVTEALDRTVGATTASMGHPSENRFVLT